MFLMLKSCSLHFGHTANIVEASLYIILRLIVSLSIETLRTNYLHSKKEIYTWYLKFWGLSPGQESKEDRGMEKTEQMGLRERKGSSTVDMCPQRIDLKIKYSNTAIFYSISWVSNLLIITLFPFCILSLSAFLDIKIIIHALLRANCISCILYVHDYLYIHSPSMSVSLC